MKRVRVVAKCVVVALALIALAGCSSSGGGVTSPGAPTRTYLGLSANPTDSAPPDSIGSVILTAQATGCTLYYHSLLWSEFEPSPGAIQGPQLRQVVSALESIGMSVYFNLRTLDTTNRGVPADLAATAFSDPAMIARLDAAVDTLIAIAKTHHFIALALGNEVDAYLSAHPGELAAYQALYEREIGRLHAQVPSLKIGMTTISPINNSNSAIGDQLNAKSDVIIYTYYPFQPATAFQHRPPNVLAGDFDAMRTHAAGKPWALQEVGYSSSPINASSDSLQADFVKRFRAYVAGTSHDDLLFANWFLYTDWSSATINYLLGYYGAATPEFAAYLGHLGLRDSVGTPKRAWNAWRGLP
jgi:hypothetical protein